MVGLKAALQQYPAPWQFEMVERMSDETEDAISVSDANGSSVAEMQCQRDVEESLAKLMTAAPDLLAACQFARSVLAANPMEMSERIAIEKLDAAIALAFTK
jgi:sensor domain CHASE-containing protein